MLVKLDHFPNFRRWIFRKNSWVATTSNTYDFTISISQCLPLFMGKWGNQKDNKSVLSVLLIDPSRWIQSRWGEIHFQWKFLHGPFQLIRPTSCDRKIWCTGWIIRTWCLNVNFSPTMPQEDQPTMIVKKTCKKNCPFVFPPLLLFVCPHQRRASTNVGHMALPSNTLTS